MKFLDLLCMDSLWYCSSLCHQLFTFIQIGPGYIVSHRKKNSINDETMYSTYFQQPSNLTATQANLLELLFSANALFLGIDFLHLNSATHFHWFLWPFWLLDLSRDQNQILCVFWLCVLIRWQISWGFPVLCAFSEV